MAQFHNKKDFETGSFLSQSLSFKTHKTYRPTTAIFTHLVSKLYKNKNLWHWFKATADAADKAKLYSICSTPELSERNFFDGLETKFTLPMGGIQQAGAPETAAKSVTLCFHFCLMNTSA